MNIKKSVMGLLSSLIIAGSCATLPIPQLNNKTPVKKQISFENSNSSLEDKVLQKTLQHNEMVETSAQYTIKRGNEEITESMGIRGSSTIISQNDDYYLVLTAKHVTELPQVLISTSSIANSTYQKHKKSKKVNTSSITTSQQLIIPSDKDKYGRMEGGNNIKKVLSSTTSGFIVAKRGKLDIKIGDIHGAEILCSSKTLDYALLRIPNNGRLSPLSENVDAFIGDTNIISRGDYVYAMGYPLGLGGLFVTDGIISNPNFPLGSIGPSSAFRDDAFMFSPPISHGNSGGPVFSVADGKLYLIGVISGYYKGGNDLNIAFKINDILSDINQKGCLKIKNSNQENLPSSYNSTKTNYQDQ